ncbi:DNA recombination protein RmuC [Paenarthrobacter sp. PH39-S1]|uniref:DNA recombination protein RmuC n=1 Tax=Paenarthrobacter sp. PH39-S1 TaxID=3046204 RepID=UPI0024B9A6EA|nr:DNA recombination protein RmuC [Paenarthrobacter sp. PH39-S1]MDJ0356041.1 DNA recombination protein RmuC [Paenarthrobacter sp. PH39-S1]
MDGFAVLLAALMLLVGLMVGAAVAAVHFRRRLAASEEDFDGVSSRLGQVTAELAGADAERRLLGTANRALGERQATDASVLNALGPVAEKLSEVQRQVGLLERDRVEQYGQLAQQLRDAKDADAQLLLTTTSLASALRSNSARGKWGEVQLRRVVEAAGMLAHVDFTEQVHTATADGISRPDMVVRLPGNKELVLDAKVPLSAYLQAHENSGLSGPASGAHGSAADTAGAALNSEELLLRHVKALKAHVDALAGKRYWEAGANTPELVICFVPAESILSSALLTDPALLDYAITRNVVLASPISLLAILKAVAFSWRQDVLTESAKELFELSSSLYTRLGTLGDNVGKLGSSLKSSVDRYNALVGTLEARVLPTARKLNSLDADTLAAPSQVDVSPRSLSAPELTADIR